MITSTANKQLKNVKLLLRSARARKEQGAFVMEGLRLVKEAPEDKVLQIFAAESFEKNHPAEDLSARFGSRYETVRDDIFKSISDTVSPQGVLAVVKQPVYTAAELAGSGDLYLLLDGIQDPGNLGTMVRTAEAAGVSALFLSPGCADLFNPKVVRSTMGSIFRVPFAVTELPPLIGELRASGVRVFGAAMEGSVLYDRADYSGRCAVVIGNEGNGISKEVLCLTDGNVRIPMAGRIESLNAAVSAAILLYEAGRGKR